MRILLCDAEAPRAESLRQLLAEQHFVVEVASDYDVMQILATGRLFDVVIVDVTSPQSCGIDAIRAIKGKTELPILLLIGASSVEERVHALDAGADDCLIKPFAFAELAARIRALLRRGHRQPRIVLTVGDLTLDRVTHTVERRGRFVELSPKEFALLEFLMRHAGQPVTRTAIVEQVWKLNLGTPTNVVDVYINYLRRKVDRGFEDTLIRTIRGVGYQIGGNGHVPEASGANL